MKRSFKPDLPDLASGNVFRLTSEDGYEIRVQCVIYGYRVQACRTGSVTLDLDWCAGADLAFIRLLFGVMEHLLGFLDPKDLPPYSDLKPAFRDLAFMAKLAALVKGPPQPSPHISAAVLSEGRATYLQLLGETSLGLLTEAQALGT